MSKWELVSVAAAGLEEYKHRQQLKRRDYFTEDNLKLLLFVINAITVIRGIYNQ